VLAAALLLAGCGGDDAELPRSGPASTPTPPPAAALKHDLTVAERELATYRFAEGTYTDDEAALSPAFPASVRITEAGTDSFRLRAEDDQGIRYVMVKRGDRVRRRCDPPDPDACPDGLW
jgi:hypothetical protein